MIIELSSMEMSASEFDLSVLLALMRAKHIIQISAVQPPPLLIGWPEIRTETNHFAPYE